jgi:nitric oxide reductase subunit B
MGVFGMLGVALLVFSCRGVTNEDSWACIDKWVRVSFWGLNLGLASMIVFNLCPGA